MLESIKAFCRKHEEEFIRAGVAIVVTTACCTIAYNWGVRDGVIRATKTLCSSLNESVDAITDLTALCLKQ